MRYLILVCAVIMQMCLGATYSWSVYVMPLREMTGLLQGTVQLPFSLFYFAFPATMILSGTLVSRIGPRPCAVGGGILFGGGWLLASLGQSHFAFTVIGIGLLAGIGVGFAYIVPIAVCIGWFPKHKGLVTGIAVAGFGGGAAAVSQIGGAMMRMGTTPFETFQTFGIAFLLLVSLAGLSMDYAPDVRKKRPEPIRPAAAIRRVEFRVLYLAMVAGLAAGFAVNANLKELYAGNTVRAGILAVSLFAVANALGRISWGIVFDRVRSASVIRANLLSQAIVLLLSPFILRSGTGLMIMAVLTGFNYGGVLVVYVSSAARIWGNERVGQVYGYLFSANIPAAIAPILAGFAYDLLNGFTLALYIIAALMVAAAWSVGKNAPLLNTHENP